MARPLRIQYPGAVYHVTCRGNERKSIFKDNKDRKTFLQLFSQSINIYNIKLFSYVLMPNHFHLLLETPLGNLGEFMRQFNISYTSHYNRRHKRSGHLYQGRYKSILVEKAPYLNILSRYIHLNPVKIKSAQKKTDKEKTELLNSYKWSSLPGYMSKKNKEKFIDYAMVLEEYGGDNTQGRQVYKKRIYNDISSKLDIKENVIGQSILGKDDFVEWVKDEFLTEERDRECPSLKEIQDYKAKGEIIKAVEKETGKSFEEIKGEKRSIRQILMDLLYRTGGMKGSEIGRLFGIGYTSVSQERRRLRKKVLKDNKLKGLISKIESACQQ